ncbi:hypothetical protein [Kocuria tytonis]|uniref:hypothetical protein n=1 Tax=Kocuria tytonis TaxID=2054280 RepID=UPI0011C3BDCC|nr:hypothetical protein [Kocuria tytonis]
MKDYSVIGCALVTKISTREYSREKKRDLNDSEWKPQPLKSTIFWDSIICIFAYVALVAFPALFGLMYEKSKNSSQEGGEAAFVEVVGEFWAVWQTQVKIALGLPDSGVLLALTGGFLTLIIAAIFSSNGNPGPATPIMLAVEIWGYLTGVYAVHSILSPIAISWGQPTWLFFGISSLVAIGVFVAVSLLRNSMIQGGIGFRFRNESEVSRRKFIRNERQNLKNVYEKIRAGDEEGGSYSICSLHGAAYKRKKLRSAIRTFVSPLAITIIAVLFFTLFRQFGVAAIILALTFLWQIFIYYFHWSIPSWKPRSGFSRVVAPSLVGLYFGMALLSTAGLSLSRIIIPYVPQLQNNLVLGVLFMTSLALIIGWLFYSSYLKAWKSFINSPDFLWLQDYALRRQICSSLRRTKKNRQSAPREGYRVPPRHRGGEAEECAEMDL